MLVWTLLFFYLQLFLIIIIFISLFFLSLIHFFNSHTSLSLSLLCIIYVCVAYNRSVDIQPAFELEGLDGEVIDVILATDVQGSNIIGAVNKDEEVFASIGNSATIQSVGQIIGVCVATTLSAAKEGAKAVKVCDILLLLLLMHVNCCCFSHQVCLVVFMILKKCFKK